MQSLEQKYSKYVYIIQLDSNLIDASYSESVVLIDVLDKFWIGGINKEKEYECKRGDIFEIYKWAKGNGFTLRIAETMLELSNSEFENFAETELFEIHNKRVHNGLI